MSIENSAFALKEQLERYKDVIGDAFFLGQRKTPNMITEGQSNNNNNCDLGRNLNMSTQQTPIEKSTNEMGGNGGGLMGDTSILQLRDAIDMLIGKLDEKIEAS